MGGYGPLGSIEMWKAVFRRPPLGGLGPLRSTRPKAVYFVFVLFIKAKLSSTHKHKAAAPS